MESLVRANWSEFVLVLAETVPTEEKTLSGLESIET